MRLVEYASGTVLESGNELKEEFIDEYLLQRVYD